MSYEDKYGIAMVESYRRYGWDGSQVDFIRKAKSIAGAISVLGSGYVIQDVLKNDEKRNHTFHRLMVGMSSIDIISSCCVHVISTMPYPKGTIVACDAIGFINTFCNFGTPLYMCSLASYYLVQLKYNWVNQRIKALEKWLHIVPWSVGLVNATFGLLMKAYGHDGFTCT